MKTYWQAEFTDLRGSVTRFNFKFATKPDAERFIAAQRKPNMLAVEIVPDDPRPEPSPEPIDHGPGDVVHVEGDDTGPSPMLTAAELTKQRKCTALAKARAAKAAKRASMVHMEHAA